MCGAVDAQPEPFDSDTLMTLARRPAPPEFEAMSLVLTRAWCTVPADILGREIDVTVYIDVMPRRDENAGCEPEYYVYKIY